MHLRTKRLITGDVSANGSKAVAEVEDWRELGEEHVLIVDVEGQKDGERARSEAAVQYSFQGSWLEDNHYLEKNG